MKSHRSQLISISENCVIYWTIEFIVEQRANLIGMVNELSFNTAISN